MKIAFATVLGLALAILPARRAAAEVVGIRIRFGLTDTQAQAWDGSVSVDTGSVERIDGWRFQKGDGIDGTSGWRASTRPLSVYRSNNPQLAAFAPLGLESRGRRGGIGDNGVVLILRDASEDSVVTVAMRRGRFQVALKEIPYGTFVERLDGAVDVERVAASQPLTQDRDDNDFPSVAVGADGTAYIAWVSFTPGLDRDARAQQEWDKKPADLSFLGKPPGGDRLWLAAFRNGKADRPLPLTEGHGDIYKCATAVDGMGRVWVFWSENAQWPGHDLAEFEIRARVLDRGGLSAPVTLAQGPGNNINPVAATDGRGRIWLAWQGARGGAFRILERHQGPDGAWSAERVASTQSGNCWAPAIAATGKAGGLVAIAWDTYEKGDYDVWLRRYSTEGAAFEAQPAANTERFESRPALTFDREGRLWVLWEEGGPLWGKDFGAYAVNKGIGLYKDRQISLRVLDGGRWMDPKTSFLKSLVGATPRRGPANLPPRRPEAEFSRGPEVRQPGGYPNIFGDGNYNSSATISCDGSGHICLFLRSREGTFMTPVGSVWLDYLVYYDGTDWHGPVILPHTDNFLYSMPAVAALPGGGMIVAHASDHRQDRHIQHWTSSSLGAEGDPFNNDIYVSQLALQKDPVRIALLPSKDLPAANPVPSALTERERAAVALCRGYRLDYNGKSLLLRRGEFHRHTEFSGDGGFDGTIEDMWRYAIDVASMDWLGCGDHDNGTGREYPWWLTQKTTDAYRVPGHFDPPFSYERSVLYPEGHRNAVFAQRGVRTLPRLPKTAASPVVHAPDTQMLYEYLRLFHGVCASHTSTTIMGTDWRDNDPELEPMVEIYQGLRQSSERPGAPRAPTPGDAISGWYPKGFVSCALMAGIKLGFEASSDHWSTHISYAMVYTGGTSREDLLSAMRQRHTYAATANIVADFRCLSGGHDYMLGDSLSASVPPTFRLRLIGTAPFSKVTWIQDDQEVKVVEPHKADVEMTWTGPQPATRRTSYTYVRGEQDDGELVWVSPIWVTYAPHG